MTVFTLDVLAEPQGSLSLVLKTLAASPGKFQRHAEASLRFWQRRALRSERYTSQPRFEASHQAAALERVPEEHGPLSLPSPPPQQPPRGSPRSPQLHQFSRGLTVDVLEVHDEGTPKCVGEGMLSRNAPGSISDCGVQRARQASSMMPVSTLPGGAGSTMMKAAVSEPSMRRGGRRRTDFAYFNLDGDWPIEVLDLLETPESLTQLHPPPSEAAGPGEVSVKFASGAWSIPHPEKADSRGADSFFHSPEGDSVGVADGVGEWEWRFKCRPRDFADDLMNGSEEFIRSLRASGEAAMLPEDVAVAAMRSAYQLATSIGSATALVAALDSDTGVLGVANLGDSTLVHLRPERVGSLNRMRAVARTQEQQHSFNCPYQLSCLPTEKDFPRLIAEGKQALARVIQRNPGVKQDLPDDANRHTFNVQEDDLIVVGTDGVFDNLHVHEICELAARTISPREAQHGCDARSAKSGAATSISPTCPGRIARAIAEAALYRSRDMQLRSPFSVHAQKAGLYHVGGKMDDITCVCAWVTRK